MEFLTAFSIVLGLGVCDESRDWCSNPVGEYGAELTIMEYDRHTLSANFRHFSDINDIDEGVNVYMGEYKYDIFRR